MIYVLNLFGLVRPAQNTAYKANWSAEDWRNKRFTLALLATGIVEHFNPRITFLENRQTELLKKQDSWLGNPTGCRLLHMWNAFEEKNTIYDLIAEDAPLVLEQLVYAIAKFCQVGVNAIVSVRRLGDDIWDL